MRTKQNAWWTDAYSQASSICREGRNPNSKRDAEEVRYKLGRLLEELTRCCDELDASDVCAVSVEAINHTVHDTGWPESVKLVI